jgi:alpha,alpha-trehalase
MKPASLMALALLLLSTACRQESKAPFSRGSAVQLYDPVKRFGQLFIDVQMAQVFPDGKTFPDCTPKMKPAAIMAAYQKAKNEPGFDLKAFVAEHFELPHQYSSNFKADTTRSTAEHIKSLWDVLTRQPDGIVSGSLIPLPKPFVVPGGRFGEVYYWDSYFTMLGLKADGRMDLVNNMLDNFAYLIDTIGFIPNGNRTYYLSRSQPPFFGMMVSLAAEEGKKTEVLVKYLPQLQKEYAFWMRGADKLNADKPTVEHCVRLAERTVLNRYWDNTTAPRAEMYAADVETAKKSKRPAKEVYQDIRSACESGWDFSSRWLRDPNDLSTIHTTDIVPVDLNCLLYHLEMTIAQAAEAKGDAALANIFVAKAAARKAAILQYCWDAKGGFFMDYDWKAKQFTPVPSIAGVFPLFINIASRDQALRCQAKIQTSFLQAGGVSSTLLKTGQQWDAPNGWAPLQYVTFQAMRNYGHNDLAETLRQRWLAINTKVYKATGKMVEKYNVYDMGLEAGGGEYPVQDGFGWSNGVFRGLEELKLMKQ